MTVARTCPGTRSFSRAASRSVLSPLLPVDGLSPLSEMRYGDRVGSPMLNSANTSATEDFFAMRDGRSDQMGSRPASSSMTLPAASESLVKHVVVTDQLLRVVSSHGWHIKMLTSNSPAEAARSAAVPLTPRWGPAPWSVPRPA